MIHKLVSWNETGESLVYSLAADHLHKNICGSPFIGSLGHKTDNPTLHVQRRDRHDRLELGRILDFSLQAMKVEEVKDVRIYGGDEQPHPPWQQCCSANVAQCIGREWEDRSPS